MNVLIACEESQRVCIAFRKKGHRAFSCDLMDCSGGHPEWHIKGDVTPLLLRGGYRFVTEDGSIHQVDKWDLVIAHPPCTYLTVSGNSWFNISKYGDKARQRYKDRYKAIVFFMQTVFAFADKVAVENPVGIMSNAFRKPDQIIQPYEYGEHARKTTCLWLKGLPKLKPTNIVDMGEINKDGQSHGASADYAVDENGKIIAWNDPRTAIIRSKTFQGIADAMADQWGGDIREETDNDLYKNQISLFDL